MLGSVVLNVGGRGWSGLDMSTPLLPDGVPGIDADPASLFSGRMGSARFTFDSLPYINSQVTVLEFAYSEDQIPIPTRIWHVPAKHANRMDARAHSSTLAECAPRFMTPRSQGFVRQSSPNLAYV